MDIIIIFAIISNFKTKPQELRALCIYGVACLLLLSSQPSFGFSQENETAVPFFGDTISIPADRSLAIQYTRPISEASISRFLQEMDNRNMAPVVNTIMEYRKAHRLDDWIYYQLIRSTAEQLSPKASNYEQYTLYKWYFLLRSGYASFLSITADKLLMYIQSDEEVFEIPVRSYRGRQYVCLNYHDYGAIDFEKEVFQMVKTGFDPSARSFSYQINRLPDFNTDRYITRELRFDYYHDNHNFRILVNPDIQKIFLNYPVLNYAHYFNMPMSQVTYSSLIPILKQYLARLDQKKGVNYLMHFVRHSFNFETDTRQFGKEKRLTPEQTLMYDNSDCEDRAAFFFYLVKEIYDLPMIVLCYPNHVTVAVSFEKKLAKSFISHKGKRFYICEPTPQKKDLKIGQGLPALKKTPYEIVYEYKTGAD